MGWVVVLKRLTAEHGGLGRRGLTAGAALGGGQLLPQLVRVVGVQLVVQRAAQPLRLRLVQHRHHRVRHVHHPARLARHHEQKAVRRLQDQVLQLLRERGRDQAQGQRPIRELKRAGAYPRKKNRHRFDLTDVPITHACVHSQTHRATGEKGPRPPPLFPLNPFCQHRL